MTCPKCAGLLVPSPSPLHLLSEYFIDTYDLQDPNGEAVQCLNCGLYSDTVTIMNKAKQADAQRLVAQAEGWADTHAVTISTMEGFYHASTDTRRTADHSHPRRPARHAVANGGETKLITEPRCSDLL